MGPIPSSLIWVWAVAIGAAWFYGYVCGRATSEDA